MLILLYVPAKNNNVKIHLYEWLNHCVPLSIDFLKSVKCTSLNYNLFEQSSFWILVILTIKLVIVLALD